MKNLSEKIKSLRIDHKMTQEELGKRIGYTKSAISKLESGKITPDIIVLKKLSAIFNISVDKILEQAKLQVRNKNSQIKELVSLEKSNYSGISNISLNKNPVRKFFFHLSWILWVVIGLILSILPFFIFPQLGRTGFMAMLIIGAIFLMLSSWPIVYIYRIRKPDLQKRMNVTCKIFKKKMVLISKKTSKSKSFYGENILEVQISRELTKHTIKIDLDNNQAITLFEVDDSILELINKIKKGGIND